VYLNLVAAVAYDGGMPAVDNRIVRVEAAGNVTPALGRPAIFFDGDDTLWLTEPLYDKARNDAALVVAQAGLNPAAWDRLEREIDVKNVARLGLSAERFPKSCVEAYEQLAQETGVAPDAEISRAVHSAALTVFSTLAPVVEDASSTLEMLGVRAALFL